MVALDCRWGIDGGHVVAISRDAHQLQEPPKRDKNKRQLRLSDSRRHRQEWSEKLIGLVFTLFQVFFPRVLESILESFPFLFSVITHG